MTNLPDGPLPPEVAWDVRRLVAQQQADTQLLRGTIQRTIRHVETLSFPLGCPVHGYDQQTILDTLNDFLPIDNHEEWLKTAREKALSP